ncbi:unnamed protein product [Rhodiola kirilowii]
MDFITHLPRSEGKTVVMVVVDRLSKFAHFCPMTSGFTSESTAKIFVREICRLHGVPTSIVSDQDPIFLSSFWQELFHRQGTLLSHSSAYHPQSDGQTEVINQVLEDYLRCYMAEVQHRWVDYLPWAEFHYNSAKHSGLGSSPFEVVYGRAPPRLVDYEPGTTPVAAVDELLIDRDQVLAQLRANLLRAQQRMCEQANKHRTDVEYAAGDWVFLRLQPYRQTSLRTNQSHKLARRYYGPFQILERIGRVAYRLALPPHDRIHDVFHVSTLKRCKATPPFDSIAWPEAFVGARPALHPATILGKRRIKQGGQELSQVLVQWAGQTSEDATWEEVTRLKLDFSDINLEDEVTSNGGPMLHPQVHQKSGAAHGRRSLLAPILRMHGRCERREKYRYPY